MRLLGDIIKLRKIVRVGIKRIAAGKRLYRAGVKVQYKSAPYGGRETRAVSDVFEYLKWRGDISFAEKRLSEIDSMILAMIVYVDFAAIFNGESSYMCDAACGYCVGDEYKSIKLGLIIPSKKINRLFCEAAKTRRFANVLVSDYVSHTREDEVCQFAAATFHLPGKRMVISYRGTDDSIVGWREDFCLSFSDEIPAQRMAVEYLEKIAKKYPDERIYLTGHSKGGNLSLYAATRASDEIKARLVKAYCHDGPGLSHEMISSDDFQSIKRKVAIYLPQSSFIGTMFDNGGKYTVLKSTALGAVQHDPFSWELDGPAFIHLESLSDRGRKNEEQFRARVGAMTLDEKREFVNTFFEMVNSTGAKTLSDFSGKGVKKLALMIKNYTGLDKKKREIMLALLLRLFDIRKSNE